jgi:septal ring factor EnvC (AmiA/AmiB activator)
MMFGLTNTKLRTAEDQRDVARATAERLHGQLQDARRQVESLRATLMQADKQNAELHEAVAREQRASRVIGAALKEVLAERDALKAEAEARRAKQLANLSAANARRKAAAELRRMPAVRLEPANPPPGHDTGMQAEAA